jgi:branched-chain amino acid transport system permease protein
LVVLLELVATNLREVTGGAHGLYIKTGFRDVPAYYAALIIAAGVGLANFLIARSGFGLALATIREDEEVAQCFGIRPFKYKALALIISASFAGLMGAVFMWEANYADPKMMFGLEKSLIPVVMAMLGGSGTVMGPIIGALFLTVIEEFLWSQMPYLHLAVYGVILALVGLFLPGGIVRAVPLMLRRVRLRLDASARKR